MTQYVIAYGLQDRMNGVKQPGRSTPHEAGPFESRGAAEQCLVNLAKNPEFTGGKIHEEQDA